jgi:RND family efflux transporter MFP subunit
MKKRSIFIVGGILIVASGVAALAMRTHEASAVNDPRQEPPLVRLAVPVQAAGSERRFTGVVAARVQSNLGFRVPGKIIRRMVDVGQQVKAGQALMQIDESDLRLALMAKRNAAIAARAVAVQARSDEKRYAALVETVAVSPQRYEQAKAALDTAEAQLAAAEAEARVAENETKYSTLEADADGTVVETLGEPGQVVSAGQVVVRLAHAGPREAVVSLPETVRPAIGSLAKASIYGDGQQRSPARLRQLSDAADPQTRTYDARYVLDGDAAAAPLGATVTVQLTNEATSSNIQVPLGALLDDGGKTGVWVLNAATSTVHFRAIKLVRMTSESAVISGLNSGDSIVSLGAQLLREGARVRTAAENRGTR